MYLIIHYWKVDKDVRVDYRNVLSIDIDDVSISIRDADGIVTYPRHQIISVQVQENR